MRFPAARISDMTLCPLVTGIVPHVGGPIVPPCCPTVITGKMPQARVSDLSICAAGGPAAIVTGAWNVLVGGSPAARITDMTSHGGRIVTGFPTVLIGMQGGGSDGGGGGGGGAPVAPPKAPKASKSCLTSAAKSGSPFVKA